MSAAAPQGTLAAADPGRPGPGPGSPGPGAGSGARPGTGSGGGTGAGPLARTGAVSFLLVLTGSALAFGTTLLAGNLLGAEGTGTLFQITAFFAIAVTVCTAGADTGLVRFLSAARARGRTGDGPALLRMALLPVAAGSACAALALWLAAPRLQQWWGLEAEASIRIAAPFVICGAVMTVLFGALRGSRQVVRFATLQNLVLPLLRMAGLGAVIFLGAATELLTAAWVLPVLLICVLAALSLRRTLTPEPASAASAPTSAPAPLPASARHPSLRPRAPKWREFWSFSGARGISAGIEVLLEWAGVLAVAVLLGPAAAGVFGVVNRCIRLGTMLDHTARIVSGPTLSEALAVGDTRAADKLFSSVTRLLILGAWPLYLVFIVFSAPVLGFFGDGFDDGASAFAVIAAAMLLVVSAGGVQSVLLMSGRSRWQLLNKAAALATAVVLYVTLIPVLGLTGAVLAWAAGALVDVGLAAFQVRRFLGIGTRLRAMALPAGLAFAVFGLGGWAVRLAAGPTLAGLLILLAAGGAAYLALLVLLRRPLGLAGFLRKPSRVQQ
ncbi:lipopolysaccharide biosynthesis protein [Arthrobacter gengyunqii]|uniref:Lipopolysaccharide biosynthesis protein n=1 Tax=Arthrobacter gengyunqii TaxID=2886940 RepID=A0ABS8GIU2_9MICC|nr:lipopolysaccharide biosynthesis protein [Arthrobacter gengyunqii]MCC3266589.1 lipopolysaccharide biosynthesis protein [Arthrobacter gengyunqii]